MSERGRFKFEYGGIYALVQQPDLSHGGRRYNVADEHFHLWLLQAGLEAARRYVGNSCPVLRELLVPHSNLSREYTSNLI